nr:capsid protein [Rat picobirnavirus]
MRRKMNKKPKSNNLQGKQGRKDSRVRRVNLDNERLSKFERDESSYKTTPKSNDVSWYMRSPEIANAAANIGFAQVTGLRDGNNIVVPGVMVLPWVGSLGGFNDGRIHNAVNQAADAIYSYTVHANSRNTSYTSADMMMAILAGKDVFVGISNLIRVYGLMLKTNQENTYLPEALLRGCGFTDMVDLRSNYSHMLYDINDLISQAKQIWIPNVMPILQRQFWMSTNVYMDSESVKGQYYMFVPAVLRKWDDTTSSQGTSLQVINTWNPLSGMTWSQAVQSIQTLINALMDSEYRGVIFGDFLKAYGEDNLFKLNYITSDYEVEAVYDKEVLTQIENSTSILGSFSTPTANAGAIIQNASMGYIAEVQSEVGNLASQARQSFPSSGTINFHFKGQPTSADIMIATRLCAVGNAALGGPDLGNPTRIIGNIPAYCGTEYVVSPYTIKYNANGLITTTRFATHYLMSEYNSSSEAMSVITNNSAFDWSPWLRTVSVSGGSPTQLPTVTTDGYIADVDNYVVVTQAELRRLHISAIMSEFGVPVLNNN